MVSPLSNRSLSTEFRRDRQGRWVLQLRGRVDRVSAGALLREIRRLPWDGDQPQVVVDLTHVVYFDDYGALCLNQIRSRVEALGGRIEVRDGGGVSASALATVDFYNRQYCRPIRPPRGDTAMVRLGDATIRHLHGSLEMLAFLGAVGLAFLRVLRHPRQLRIGDTLTAMEKTGVNAVPIIGLIGCLLGLVMAFMSSLQLAQFGANIYVASLVALAMVSELGPIMTAIVVAGRSGSAFAAEIGSMKLAEEIDALTTMGFDPTLFLAVPRIVATVLVVPVLTLLANLFAIAGGMTVGVLVLDLTAATYMHRTLEALTLFELLWGFSKSIVFAGLVALIGCLRGFQASGGADAIGNAATSAVVTGIFVVILFDSIFAVVRGHL
jgi:phospholipid/cholesterol/gamma-HCH transport system permease protein